MGPGPQASSPGLRAQGSGPMAHLGPGPGACGPGPGGQGPMALGLRARSLGALNTLAGSRPALAKPGMLAKPAKPRWLDWPDQAGCAMLGQAG